MRSRPTPGRPPNLSPVQKKRLAALLLKGPLAAGYRTDLWTLKRVAQLIRKQFWGRDHPCHVWKLLTSLGWSCQKPERRALQRDDAAIARWRRARWPHIKNAARRGAHLVFLDESGFLLIPNVARTWAPKGRTPIVRDGYKQDRISAISALAVSPKRRRVALYLRLRRRNLTGLDVRAFLQHLLRHLRGPVVLLWDRGTIHRRKEVTHGTTAYPRLHVEEFPAYAPDLNPAEYVWPQADRALIVRPWMWFSSTGCSGYTVRRLRHSQGLLWACIYASDLPWAR